MKTTTKPHKAKTPKKGKGKGLKGAGAQKLKAATKGMGNEVARPIGVIVGLVGSSLAGSLLDKVPFLAPKEGEEPSTIKKLAKPLILAAAGGATVYFTHGKKETGMQFANGLGYGFIGGGVISGTRKFMSKDLTAGLGQSPAQSKAELEAKYYKDSVADMAKLLEANKFDPALPGYEQPTNGIGAENVTSELKVENSDVII